MSCIGHRGYTPTWSFPYLSSLHLSTSRADHLHFGFRVLALSSFPHSPDTRLLSSHSTQPGSLKIITMILALEPFLPVSADDICKFNLLFFFIALSVWRNGQTLFLTNLFIHALPNMFSTDWISLGYWTGERPQARYEPSPSPQTRPPSFAGHWKAVIFHNILKSALELEKLIFTSWQLRQTNGSSILPNSSHPFLNSPIYCYCPHSEISKT